MSAKYIISNLTLGTLIYKDKSTTDFIVIDESDYDPILIENLTSQKLAKVTKVVDKIQQVRSKKKKNETDNSTGGI